MNKVLEYLKAHAPSLIEDFKKTHYKEKGKVTYRGKTYNVSTITQYVAEGVLLRHWLWISHDDIMLVNSEIKFKASPLQRTHSKIVINKKSKINSSSQYESIGMGTQLTKIHCETSNLKRTLSKVS